MRLSLALCVSAAVAAAETCAYHDHELVGRWVTNFGSDITITGDKWITVATYGVSVNSVSEMSDKYVIAQNATDDAYNPSKWRKEEYQWTDESKDEWSYCSSVYDAADEATAKGKDTTLDNDSNGSADYDSTNQASGCNGFIHTAVTPLSAMPVAGTWTDNYGSTLTITEDKWIQGARRAPWWISRSASGTASEYAITMYGAKFMVAQNGAANAYNPSKWTKMQFHMIGTNKFGYCQTVYDGATEMGALTTGTSAIYDASDAASGCNGFPHSIATLTRAAMPILGSWTDSYSGTNYGSTLTITEDKWISISASGTVSEYAITMYGAKFMVAQNGAANAYNPSKWTKMQFHMIGTNKFGFCQTVYDGATEMGALTTATSAIYDSANAASGCNGVPHLIATLTARSSLPLNGCKGTGTEQ